MKVRIARGPEGSFTYALDDLRGATASRVRGSAASVAELKTKLAVGIADWAERKAAIRAARRGTSV